MNQLISTRKGRRYGVALVFSLFVGVTQAADTGTAEKTLKAGGCTKCHAAEKGKDGPAYRDVAAKFRGTPDAESKITHHITSGEKVKFADGHQEDHKKVKSNDPAEIKNLVEWILALPGGTKY
jgi:cytochrome c